MERPWLKNYPKGVSPEVDINQYQCIGQMFEETCNQFGPRIAFENMGSILTFEELEEMSRDFASFFLNVVGLEKGDRVAIQMPNLLQYPVVMFGALRAGLVVVNTNPLYTEREMCHQLKDSGAKAIVILANFAYHLEKIIEKTKITTVVVTQLGDLLGWPKSLLVNFAVKYIKKMVPTYKLPKTYNFYEALDLGEEKKFNPEACQPEDLAFLQYTGGTTGVPKGAMLTHKNILSNMIQIAEWMKPRLIKGEEVVITALPLYHIFSLTVNCLSMMYYGSTNILITNPKDIDGFIKTLKKINFTFFTGVNTLFNALMNHPDFNQINFKSMKISVAGGTALQKNVSQEWLKKTGTPVVEGYGLTEASPVTSCNPTDRTDRVGTIGLPIPNTLMKICDNNGTPLPPGQSGELVIYGPQTMKGYWQKPEETSKVFMPDGGLITGDIAIMDKDGFFKIVDRKKDMILVSGFNVYPNEVEGVIALHTKVMEVAAVGVKDEKSGEAVKVFVVKKDTSLTPEELLDYCRQNLVAYKIPKHIEFRKELPKTNVGKILHRALRKD